MCKNERRGRFVIVVEVARDPPKMKKKEKEKDKKGLKGVYVDELPRSFVRIMSSDFIHSNAGQRR